MRIPILALSPFFVPHDTLPAVRALLNVVSESRQGCGTARLPVAVQSGKYLGQVAAVALPRAQGRTIPVQACSGPGTTRLSPGLMPAS